MCVTDVDIQRWVEQTYGFVPHPFWIAHCKELYLLVENAGNPRKPWHECPPEKRLMIREALAHFGFLEEPQPALAAGGRISIDVSLNRHQQK
jgi:hypothetical protein